MNDRREQLANERLFESCLSEKSLGRPEVVRELILQMLDRLDQIGEWDAEEHCEARDEILGEIALRFLGDDPAYPAVPGWNKPGMIDQHVAKSNCEILGTDHPQAIIEYFLLRTAEEVFALVGRPGAQMQSVIDRTTQILLGLSEH